MTLMQVADFTAFVEGLDHPECVTVGPDGQLYAGGEAGQIYRLTIEGEDLLELATTKGFVLGICLDADSTVYACDPGNSSVMRITAAGEVSAYSTGTAERGFVNPNYPVFDRSGNLYVSDSGGWHKNDGCLWVIRPGGAAEVIDQSVAQFPNGLALNAAEDFLYLAMSTLPGVVRVPVAAGRVTGPAEEVVLLPRTVPDGLAFDEAGNLYISCYAPDVVYRLDPGGALEVLVEDWERTTIASPTNLTFAGPDRKTLVLASLSRWHLAKGAVAVAGQPYNYPSLG